MSYIIYLSSNEFYLEVLTKMKRNSKRLK